MFRSLVSFAPFQLISQGPVQTVFLHKHDISNFNVESLITLPYSKGDQYIRAFMSETVSMFKDIAQLNPLFRDQITKISINQAAANVYDDRTNLPILQPLYPPAKFKNY